MKALPQGGPIRECVEGGVMSELPQSGASPIQRSWERCLHQGLSRQQSAELDLLPQGELSARQEQHRTLIACFQRFVLPLFGQLLAGRPCRLLLCDGEGAILAVSGVLVALLIGVSYWVKLVEHALPAQSASSLATG